MKMKIFSVNYNYIECHPNIINIICTGEKFQLIADVFYFLLRISDKYDIDLSRALENKMKKSEIKYPVHKCKGINKKYNELD